MALKLKPDAADNTNQTTFGSSRGGRGVVAVNSLTDALPSALCLVDSSGTEWFIWFQSSKLTVGTRAQFIAQSGGTATH